VRIDVDAIDARRAKGTAHHGGSNPSAAADLEHPSARLERPQAPEV
jgi:hypothetical protein